MSSRPRFSAIPFVYLLIFLAAIFFVFFPQNVTDAFVGNACLIIPVLAAFFSGIIFAAIRASKRAALARHRRSLGLCPSCAYDRRGLATGALCPECGSKP